MNLVIAAFTQPVAATKAYFALILSADDYEAGQSFSELPGDRHGVSANASKTQPAKLLAVFVVDTNETDLTIPFGN